ncbi:hypothetical protein [Tahibacter sp.]|uniref:hypothetical protein n=1 Tax=Tahibacter sp. TaxID=2056211 RepID=UPI0028C428F5|nr:hypothetical protein [Tahibacter sp.]
MDPLSVLTALAPLILEWAKEHRNQGEEASEEAFRTWLQTVAFEELLNAATVAFKTVLVSQKAHHHELIEFLTKQFSEVRSALNDRLSGLPSVPTLQTRWEELHTEGQALLMQLVAQVDGNTYEDARMSTPYAVDGSTKEDIAAGKKRLVEAGLAREAPYTGGATLCLTAMGLLVSEAIADPEEFQSKLLRIQDGLRRYGSAPVDKLVAHCMKRCSPALLYAIVERWDKLGWVALQKLDQRERSRVSHPAQLMRDANAESLMQATLRPFVGPS